MCAADFAAVDVGSNSVKLRIATRARRDGGWTWAVRHDEVAITRLGRGLDRRPTLDPEAAAATLTALEGFAATVAVRGCAGVAAVATQAVREAHDGAAFAATVRARTGLPLDVVSGDEEARLAFLGAGADLAPGAMFVACDVGGRSTELASGPRDRLAWRLSLPVGVVGVTERCLGGDPPPAAELAAAGALVRDALRSLPARQTPLLVATGGTPASLAAIEAGPPARDAAAVHGRRLGREAVARLTERLARLTVAERRRLPGLHPDRAGVILAGAVILGAVMDRLRCGELRVSIHGLRQGLLRDRFEGGGA